MSKALWTRLVIFSCNDMCVSACTNHRQSMSSILLRGWLFGHVAPSGRENIVGTGHPQTEIANNYIIYAATTFCGTTLPSSGFVGVFEKQWAFLEEEWQDYKQHGLSLSTNTPWDCNVYSLPHDGCLRTTSHCSFLWSSLDVHLVGSCRSLWENLRYLLSYLIFMKINLEKVHSLWLVFQVKNTLLNVKAWRQHCLRKMSSKKLTPTLSFRCIFLFAKLSKWQKTLWLGIFRCGSISRRTFRCSLTELINYSSWEKPWLWILWISAMSWIQLLEWMPISSSCTALHVTKSVTPRYLGNREW